MADVFEWRADLSSWRSRLWDLIGRTPNLDWLLLTKRPHLAQRLTPWGNSWPHNVWMGTTVESQSFAKKRIPQLASVPARIRFLSCEPLLGPLDLQSWLEAGVIDWIIAGGESGPGARSAEPGWFRDLRDQCLHHSVAFHFKQWGDWAPLRAVQTEHVPASVEVARWSEAVGRFGKHASGRRLDGKVWDDLPKPVRLQDRTILAVP